MRASGAGTPSMLMGNELRAPARQLCICYENKSSLRRYLVGRRLILCSWIDKNDREDLRRRQLSVWGICVNARRYLTPILHAFSSFGVFDLGDKSKQINQKSLGVELLWVTPSLVLGPKATSCATVLLPVKAPLERRGWDFEELRPRK